MIRLKKRPSVPQTLLSDVVSLLRNQLKQRVGQGQRLQSVDFDSKHWRKDDVLTALWSMHRGKCCYCERKRDKKRESDVEHFRPKAEVTDYHHHPGYWWLAYEWTNYLLSCKKCNQEHKKNHFPLIDDKPAMSPEDDLAQERPFLVNPAEEDPEEFITFEWGDAAGIYVKAVGRDDLGRGQKTIEVTGLNEGTLLRQRAELVTTLLEIASAMYHAIERGAKPEIDNTARLIRERTSPAREFAGFQRAFFRDIGLGKYVTND